MNLSLEDETFIKFISKTKVDYPSLVLDFWIKEQIRFRMYICQDCFSNGKCIACSCNTDDTLVERRSCNNEEYFPNLMNRYKWEEFKKERNLTFK